MIVRRVAHQADALSDDPRARRKRTIPREQLDLGLSGEADVIYGYSFILTDLAGEAAEVEHHHRDRAQIEERTKDAKLGVSLRRLPLSDLEANRVWLHCSTLALNLLALLNDLMFGIDPPGHLPRRRQAKFVRRMLLCVPARVIHHARRIVLRLPAGLVSAPAFQAAYTAARPRATTTGRLTAYDNSVAMPTTTVPARTQLERPPITAPTPLARPPPPPALTPGAAPETHTTLDAAPQTRFNAYSRITVRPPPARTGRRP